MNADNYNRLVSKLEEKKVTLVAVSKTKPVELIMELYHMGQRDFGENYVQEIEAKHALLPKDIRWHYIGHLQTNKVKYIADFVHLIQSVDSEKLLKEIDKQARKHNRIINCLLQIYIAKEETKFGLNFNEAETIINNKSSFPNVNICGLMGMASNTDDTQVVADEFYSLAFFFKKMKFKILSMGMSSDYETAIDAGSNMVRIGSIIFGERAQNPSL
jgi:PLP dependent protein